MNTFGKVLLAGLTVAANHIEHQNKQRTQESAADREERLWDERKQEALLSIDRALEIEHDTVMDTTQRRNAERLRSEVLQYCRSRSDVLMNYTEKCIAKFASTGLA